MLTIKFFERMEAIRLHQLNQVNAGKPSPKIYEQLTQLPVNEVVRMFDIVDATVLSEKTDTLIKKLKDGLKSDLFNK